MTKRLSHAVRALGLALVGLVVCAMLAAPASALAETTYVVRVYGGNEGVVKGQGEGGYAEKKVAAGEPIKLSQEFPVELNDPEKYYQRGYRQSGKDNLVGSADYISSVTSDMDFVVSYGAMGEMTTYTIRFVEYGTGKALKDDQDRTEVTYRGKVGDKPVVAFSYVPGYRPLYNNVTGTLQAGENVWELPYAAVEEGTTESGSSGGGTTGGGTTGGGTTGGGTTAQQGTAGGGTAAGGEAAAGTETGADAGTEDGTDDETGFTPSVLPEDTEETTAAPETEEILDMDNPLAGGDGGNSEVLADDGTTDGATSGGMSAGLIAALVAAAAAVAGGLWFFFKRKKKGSKAESEPDQKPGDEEATNG